MSYIRDVSKEHLTIKLKEYGTNISSHFVCVVLPVAIIAIIFRGLQSTATTSAPKYLIKAIESNWYDIDADKLAEALQKPKKRPWKFSISVYSVAVSSRSVGIAVCIIGIIAYSMGMEFRDRRGYRSIDIPVAFRLAIGLSYLVVYFVTRKQINE